MSSNLSIREMKLSQLQAIAKAPVHAGAFSQAKMRLVESVTQSMLMAGYPVTFEQSAESAKRIFG